jgi:hypothetical protein
VRSTDQAGSGECALRSVRLDPLPRPRQRFYLVNAIVSAEAVNGPAQQRVAVRFACDRLLRLGRVVNGGGEGAGRRWPRVRGDFPRRIRGRDGSRLSGAGASARGRRVAPGDLHREYRRCVSPWVLLHTSAGASSRIGLPTTFIGNRILRRSHNLFDAPTRARDYA